MNDQNKNLILATALSVLVILGWMWFFPPAQQAPTDPTQPAVSASGDGVAVPNVAGTTAAVPALSVSPEESRSAALAKSARVPIDTPRLKGSISLKGGRIDDLALKDYRVTLDPQSDLFTLLSPAEGPDAYYALYGWAPAGDLEPSAVPGPATPWTVEAGQTLSVGQPITLVWDNAQGLTFHRTISVDADYMFTITQSVTNTGEAERRLAPYGIIARHGEPKSQRFFILHEGVVEMTDGKLQEIKYSKMPDAEYVDREAARAVITNVEHDGWIGFTDKYWMTNLVGTPGQPFTAVSKFTEAADIYQTEMRLPTMVVAPGATQQVSSMLFAGAKEWETIREYENNLGIVNFVDSIDWGWFFFLTKPIFHVLHSLNGLIGNMGLSIIGLTLLIKAILFPLAYKSYVSMARMKELQPQIEKLKEKVGDDRGKLQAEMMALYKTQKVNPAAGCLPILLQIPIFFSLYKVIFVTIELRHAPFFGWIRDLSAPDPSSILNLFGLLPYAPPDPTSFFAILSLGVLPILLGISMWVQQKLNPAPTDATQAMIFAWMPWIFMFMLGQFASGLVIYWIANNTITFTQQYIIMRTHGHRPDVFGNIRSTFRRKSRTKAAGKPANDPAKPAKKPTVKK